MFGSHVWPRLHLRLIKSFSIRKTWKDNRTKRILKISLASTSDSSGDDGGQPPRKKSRRDSATCIDSMQAASNGCVQNGAASGSNGAAENGHGDIAIEAGAPAVSLSQTSQDIVRLIGQYLKNEGLK